MIRHAGHAASAGARRRQRGVAAIEFALIFLFGMLPLLMLTFSGVLIFAAKQSLTLAASEGARAALRYDTTAGRVATACTIAKGSMQWLLNFAGVPAAAGCDASAGIATVTAQAQACPSSPGLTCIKVTASYAYDQKPFLPGTRAVYGWLLGKAISSDATAQLDPTVQP